MYTLTTGNTFPGGIAQCRVLRNNAQNLYFMGNTNILSVRHVRRALRIFVYDAAVHSNISLFSCWTCMKE